MHGIDYSPKMGSQWWRCCLQDRSKWRIVISRGLEAAQTCSEHRAASQCLRAEWCCGRSLWCGTSTEAKTSAASPCLCTPSMQTGNIHIDMHQSSPEYDAASAFSFHHSHHFYPLSSQRSISPCWGPWVPVSLCHSLSSPELLALGRRQRPSAHTADGDPAHQGIKVTHAVYV